MGMLNGDWTLPKYVPEKFIAKPEKYVAKPEKYNVEFEKFIVKT